MRIVATQPTFAEAAIQRAILGNTVFSTRNRTNLIAALELGALAADGACSAESEEILKRDIGARSGEV